MRSVEALHFLLCLAVAGGIEEAGHVLSGGVSADAGAPSGSVRKSGGGDAFVDVSKPLWSQAACKEEFTAFECSAAKEAKDNNFLAVVCLTTQGTTRQAAEEAADDPSRTGALSSKAVLSDACQHVIWDAFAITFSYVNLTKLYSIS